jgi:hypothetical protein
VSLRGIVPGKNDLAAKGKCIEQVCKIRNFVSVSGASIWKIQSVFSRDVIRQRLQRHATCSTSARPGCTLHPCHHKTLCQRPLHLTVGENYFILTVRIEMGTRSKPYQLERLANVSGLVIGAVGYKWKTFIFQSV